MNILRYDGGFIEIEVKHFESMLPLFAVRFCPFAMIYPANHVRQFVQQGDKKFMWIQIVINGDAMRQAAMPGPEIAEFAGSRTRDTQHSAVLLKHLHGFINALRMQVFIENLLVRHGALPSQQWIPHCFPAR